MIDLNDAVSLLRANREELLAQLEAVDKALAALSGVGAGVTPATARNPQEATEQTPGAVLPTKVKAPRTLSDEHQHALSEGRRKARHSKDVAAGLARELPGPSAGLAPAAGRQPRLVKRTKQ